MLVIIGDLKNTLLKLNLCYLFFSSCSYVPPPTPTLPPPRRHELVSHESSTMIQGCQILNNAVACSHNELRRPPWTVNSLPVTSQILYFLTTTNLWSPKSL